MASSTKTKRGSHNSRVVGDLTDTLFPQQVVPVVIASGFSILVELAHHNQ